MYFLSKVYKCVLKLSNHAKTPRHILQEIIKDSICLLSELQTPDIIFNGFLTCTLLSYLCICKVPLSTILSSIKLCPSFNVPCNVLLLSRLSDQTEKILYLELAASFYCFEAWNILSESLHFSALCLDYCSTTENLNDILAFVKIQVTHKKHGVAKQALSSGLRFESPIVYRLLSRMHYSSSPAQALEYSRMAVELGDIQAQSILSALLDAPDLQKEVCGGQVSSYRVQLISSLIVKLDYSFFSYTQHSPGAQQQGFISFIAGSHSVSIII